MVVPEQRDAQSSRESDVTRGQAAVFRLQDFDIRVPQLVESDSIWLTLLLWAVVSALYRNYRHRHRHAHIVKHQV